MPLRHPHPDSRVLRKIKPLPATKNKEIGKVAGGISRDRIAKDDDEENSTVEPTLAVATVPVDC